jgi:hypothetical protein
MIEGHIQEDVHITMTKILGPLLLISGIILDLVIVWHFSSKVLRISRWAKTTGTVTRHEVVTSAPDEGTFYTPVVEFADRSSQRYELVLAQKPHRTKHEGGLRSEGSASDRL